LWKNCAEQERIVGIARTFGGRLRMGCHNHQKKPSAQKNHSLKAPKRPQKTRPGTKVGGARGKEQDSNKGKIRKNAGLRKDNLSENRKNALPSATGQSKEEKNWGESKKPKTSTVKRSTSPDRTR